MKKGSRVILAIDLGGSKYMVGLISDDGEIIKKKRYEWRSYDADEIIKQICTAVDAMRQGYPDWHPELIGMTIPGLADAQKGIWKRSGFMGVRNLPIAPILQETYQMPTFIDNDCRACALAEKRFGTARDCDDFFLYYSKQRDRRSAVSQRKIVHRRRRKQRGDWADSR